MEGIRIPEKWNEWTDLEKVGEGSYGTVYKASRKIGGEAVYCAIKVIRVPKEKQEMEEMLHFLGKETSLKEYYRDLVDDYIREIQAMERLKGITNIVTIQDYALEPDEDGFSWTVFIQMEYLTPFQTYIITHPVDEEEVIRLGTDICNALIYCEKAGIVHKDLKVENIFVSDMGNYKLGDFGVARNMDRTMSTYSTRGTFSYMAPEVYRGEPYDYRADIYSLGLVMYRLLNNNREPFLPADKQIIYFREREDALIKRMTGEDVPPPAMASPALSKIILKAISYEKEDRFSSALDMREALQELTDKKSEMKTGTKASRKKKNTWFFLCIVIGAVFLGIILYTLTRKKADDNKKEKRVVLLSETAASEESESNVPSETLDINENGNEKEFIQIDVSGFVGLELSKDGTSAWKWTNTKKVYEALKEAGVSEDDANDLAEQFSDQFLVEKDSTQADADKAFTIMYQPSTSYKDLLEKAGVTISYSAKEGR